MMRILHVVTSFHLGGSEQVVIDLATWLRSAGHVVDIAAVWKDPAAGAYGQSLRQRLGAAGVQFSDLGGFNFRRSLPQIFSGWPAKSILSNPISCTRTPTSPILWFR